MKKVRIILIALVPLFIAFVYFLSIDDISSTHPDMEGRLLSEKQRLVKSKGQSPNGFVEYFQAITYKPGKQYQPNYKFKEFNKAKDNYPQSNVRMTSMVSEVTSRGPGNVGGRTRAIVVDPDDDTHSTWFAGSASGGIWKTTDKGQTWTNLTEDLPNLSTNSLAIAPSNHNVMYAGTGEVFATNLSFVRGNGIFKSTEKGAVGSWSQLESTTNDSKFNSVNRIVIDPASEDVLVICTNEGIYRSTDGGVSWTEVYKSQSEVQDLAATSGNFNLQYAGVNGIGIIKSVDGGQSWVKSSDGIGEGERFEIAIAPSNPDLIYTSTYNSEDETLIYRSTDAGETWALLAFSSDEYYLGEQGWYDNSIAVNPYDENEVYVGGVYVGKYLVTGETATTDPDFIGVDLENVGFLSFVNFGQTAFGGALALGDGSDSSTEFFNVEIRFGSGMSQKAHRFQVPADGGTNSNGGPGVPDEDYAYQDYIDVPFEVWDIDNNRQLMISFRDQQRDGAFNLNPRDDTNDPDLLLSREYLFISNIDYSESPDSQITVDGGHLAKNMYFFWPILTDGETWDENSEQTGIMRIKYGSLITVDATPEAVSDSRGTYGGKNSGLHADHHNLTFIKTDEENETFMIVNGNDGGLGLSEDNGETWTQILDGYVTTQFYGADKKPGADEFFGGMQDNGTWLSPGGESASEESQYSEKIGGDGFEVIWHAQDPDKLIGGFQNGGFRRSIDGGILWQGAEVSFRSGTATVPFISRLASSRTNPDVVYVPLAEGVAKSVDFAETWGRRAISATEGWTQSDADGAPIAYSTFDMEVSLSNHNIVWGGCAMTNNINVFVSVDAGEVFNPVTKYGVMGSVSGIATHPHQDSTAYLLFSIQGLPKVIRTEDLGASWEDISGFEGNDGSDNGFPDVIAHSLLVMPHQPETIWVGTEIGLFESTDDGVSWHYADIGLPAVSIWSMKVVDDQVVFGTHGRGIWTATIDALPSSQSLIKTAEYGGQLSLQLGVGFAADHDKVDFYVDKVLVESLTDVSAGDTDITLTIEPSLLENSELYMITENGGKSIRSIKQFVDVDFTPEILSASQGDQSALEVNLTLGLNELYSKVDVIVNGEVATSLGAITEVGEVSVNVPVAQSGEKVISVLGYLGDFTFTSLETTVDVTVLGIKDIADNFSIYPNPAQRYVTINALDQSSIQSVEVLTLSGASLMNVDATKNNGVINLESVEAGVYFLKVATDNGTFTKRVIKQ
ncbi:MAG: T9SS type A sorting domain-containing protein [Cyclobacteriaceae bacterium]